MSEEKKKETKTPMPKHCNVRRNDFLEKAANMTLQFRPVGDDTSLIGSLPCEVKLFKTGSFGWYSHGKIHINFNGERVPVQISMSATVVNSKIAED